MDKLTAYRTFGNPAYKPRVAHVIIYDKRWYLVRMQRASHDQGDGYYLEEGEYVELLPGAEVRQRQDARLNRYNVVQEWMGEVWACEDPTRGSYGTTYHTSKAEAERMAAEVRRENATHLAEALKALDRDIGRPDKEIEAKYGRYSDWRGAEAMRAQWREMRANNQAFWAQAPTVSRVR